MEAPLAEPYLVQTKSYDMQTTQLGFESSMTRGSVPITPDYADLTQLFFMAIHTALSNDMAGGGAYVTTSVCDNIN